jgi:3D (Asp-Asp-Asp) domain-containing protein
MALVASVTFAKDKPFITHVTLTTYNAVKNQCDDSPLITADGTKIDIRKLKRGKIKYCAVSRDLLWCIPLGSVVHIEGHGYYEVRDTMNERFNHYIDILQHKSQKNFKKERIRVEVIKKPKKKSNFAKKREKIV